MKALWFNVQLTDVMDGNWSVIYRACKFSCTKKKKKTKTHFFKHSFLVFLFNSATVNWSKRQHTSSGRVEELLLQWFMESIIKHKSVYGRYMHRLHFVCNPSITPKPSLFNFMFQLADDSNFILYLQPLCPASLCLILSPPYFTAFFPCFFSPLYFLVDWLLLSLRITRELRKSYETEESATVVMVPFKQQVLDHFCSCP